MSSSSSPPPLHHHLLLLFLLSVLSLSSALEVTVISHPAAKILLPPPSPLAADYPGSPLSCARVHLHGRLSRLRDPSRFFHALRVRANLSQVDAILRPQTVELCFHRNASVKPCMCEASQWQKMPKNGQWTQAISPYDYRILDFRMPPKPSRAIEVSTEEEFLLHRVVFLVLGVVLMAVAHVLSESVVFYYGGAMTIGIFLVVLIILFQGMKLLPTGRKSSLAIFAYSTVVGMTTYFLHYLSGLLRSMLVEIGISEDMHNPLGIFLLVCIVLAGAWFGYWGVRKFVLTEEGSVDAGVAYFVEWATLIFSAVLILQSSVDIFFACASLVICIVVKAFSRIEGKCRFLRRTSRRIYKIAKRITVRSSPSKDSDGYYSSMYGTPQDGFGKLHGQYSRHASQNLSAFGSGSRLSRRVVQDNYYSIFHKTPERRKFSKEEYDAFTKEQTKKAMSELLSSPDFNRWAVANADRISVSPPGTGSSSSSQRRYRFLEWF